MKSSSRQSWQAVQSCCPILIRNPYFGSMNQPNQGQILNLSQDVVVETFAMTNAAGANPTSLSLLPVGILSVVQQHGGNQEMIEEAAISGKRDLAMKVMINDPMVTNIEKYE